MKKLLSKEDVYYVGIDPASKTFSGVCLGKNNEVLLAFKFEVDECYSNLEKVIKSIISLFGAEKELVFVIERFVTYGKFSMALIEKVNEIIGVTKYLIYKNSPPGKKYKIITKTYNRWISQIVNDLDLIPENLGKVKKIKKDKRSKYLAEKIINEKDLIPLRDIDKQDHLIDSYLIALSEKLTNQLK